MKLFLANVWGWITLHKKIVLWCIAGLLTIALILFAADRLSNWWSGRKIDKLRANVNAATQELKQSQDNVNLGKRDEIEKLKIVNVAVNEYANATNATDAARAETNRALNNMAAAVNANHNVGITADDLDKKLRELGE